MIDHSTSWKYLLHRIRVGLRRRVCGFTQTIPNVHLGKLRHNVMPCSICRLCHDLLKALDGVCRIGTWTQFPDPELIKFQLSPYHSEIRVVRTRVPRGSRAARIHPSGWV